MRPLTPYSSLKGNSWAEDFTPSGEIRQKYMYVQCMGHYEATPSYSVISRSNLHISAVTACNHLAVSILKQELELYLSGFV